MKHILTALVLSLCFASCETFDYHAVAANGSTEEFHIKTFGGSQSTESAGGTRHTSNHVKNAGQAFQTVSAVAGVVGNAYGVGVGEVTARAKSADGVKINGQNVKGATDQLKITTDGANEAAEIAAKAAQKP